jgi:hypothetical protein
MNVLHKGKGLSDDMEQESIFYSISTFCCIVQVCVFGTMLYDATD